MTLEELDAQTVYVDPAIIPARFGGIMADEERIFIGVVNNPDHTLFLYEDDCDYDWRSDTNHYPYSTENVHMDIASYASLPFITVWYESDRVYADRFYMDRHEWVIRLNILDAVMNLYKARLKLTELLAAL